MAASVSLICVPYFIFLTLALCTRSLFKQKIFSSEDEATWCGILHCGKNWEKTEMFLTWNKTSEREGEGGEEEGSGKEETESPNCKNKMAQVDGKWGI